MKNKRFWLIIVATVIIAAIAVFGVRLINKLAEKEQVIKIGAILPLTGSASSLGEWVKNGIDLAVQHVNSQGGVNGRKIEILFGDSRNDPKEGVNAYNQMIALYNPPIIISAMTGVTNALIPLATTDKKVLFATTVSASDITDQSPWVFRLFINADIDAKTMAEFAAKQLGIKSAGILYVNDDMGLSFAKVFREVFEKNAGKITFSEEFEKGTTDFRNLLSRIKEEKADAVYLLGYDNNLGVLPNQMREMGITIRILSIGTIAQPNVISQAAPALEGTFFTTTEFSADDPKTEVASAFARDYAARFGSAPNYFGAFAYDTINVIVSAMRKQGITSPAIRNGLLEITDFNGVSGKISIKSNRDADFPMIVKTIKNGRSVDVEQ